MSKPSPQAYLLIGKERFLKREFIQDLRGRLLGRSADASLNFQEFSGKKNELVAAFDFVSTTPFLSDKRIAVLWEADSLSEEAKEMLAESILKLSSSGVLVIVSEEASAKKNNFLREISSLCALVPCHVPFERDLPKWIENRVQKHGKKIAQSTIPHLVERAGRDLSSLAPAIEQLVLYSDPRNEISAEDVRDLLGRSAEEDVFRLADLLLEAQTEKALAVLDGLLGEGMKSMEILGALTSQLERFKRGSDLLAKGHSHQEIGTRLGLHPYFQEKFMAQLKRLPLSRLEAILKKLLLCDEEIKTSRLSERLAVERFLLTISPLRAN